MKGQSGYMLGGLIARGGMAEIFLGKAVGGDRFERLCAIKRILPHYNEDKEFVRMFRDEAHICMRLQHANIVQVYDFQEVNGAYAIIMEYVNGADLRSMLAACEKTNSRLSVPMAIYVAAEAARGLHYAHTKVDELTRQHLGIVHRDVSPQNILVSFEGEVKITDFGIADADGKQTETKPGIVKGKYSYMSPEQVTAKDLDARSDVFSLAIVLWEMLAMRRLFAGKNEVDTIRKVQACEISFDLRAENPEVDERLLKIVNRGLSRDRKKRYPSARDFEKDLRKYLHHRYPDFSAATLGSFITKLMAKKRDEADTAIKQTLTSQSDVPDIIRSQTATPLSQVHDVQAIANSPAPAPHESGVASPKMTIELDDADAQRSPFSIAAGHSRMGVRTGTGPVQRTYGSAMPTGRRDSGSVVSYRQAYQSGTSWLLPGAITALMVILIGVLITQQRERPKPTTMSVLLETIPKQVRISIDGKPVSKGRYINTPTIIPNLDPGLHQVTIQRDTYSSQTLNINGAAGEQVSHRSIVLERDAGVRRAPVKIEVRGAPEVRISINDGYYTGTAPTSINDLPFGEPASVIVATPTGVRFRCRFQPRSASFRYPFVLTIDISESPGRCTARAP